jgi:hypothetical protein
MIKITVPGKSGSSLDHTIEFLYGDFTVEVHICGHESPE